MRKIMWLLLLLIFIGLPAGFSRGGAEKSDSVTLQFALWDKTLQPAFEVIAQEYEKNNSNISIDFVNTPWAQYWTRMEAAVTGEAAPDIFWMNAPNLLTYVKAGIIEPLTDLYTEEMKQNIAEVPRRLYTIKGEIWGVPLFYDTIGIFYNKGIFDTYGVSHPENDWSWDDFIKTMRALKEKMPVDSYPLAMYALSQETMYPYISSAGGYVISDDKKKSGMNSPQVQDAYEKIVQVYQEGLAVPVTTISGENNMGNRLFASGKVAMLQAGVWQASVIDGLDFASEVGVVELPRIKQKGNVAHALVAAAYSKSEHLSEARDFLTFMASDFAYKTIAEYLVGLPANTNFSSNYLESFENIDITPYVKAVDYSMLYPFSLDVGKWGSTLEQISIAIFNGTESPQQGLEKIHDKMQQILDKESY